MMDKMSKVKIEAALRTLHDWALVEDGASITKQFQFRNFVEAFGFMTEAALIAEKMDHHPEWTNVWRKVAVTLTTHSAKGLTELDFTLAKAMDDIVASRRHKP